MSTRQAASDQCEAWPGQSVISDTIEQLCTFLPACIRAKWGHFSSFLLDSRTCIC